MENSSHDTLRVIEKEFNILIRALNLFWGNTRNQFRIRRNRHSAIQKYIISALGLEKVLFWRLFFPPSYQNVHGVKILQPKEHIFNIFVVSM